jgi:hypothetical protein
MPVQPRRRRDEPDAVTPIMQQRLHEVWQQPEASAMTA